MDYVTRPKRSFRLAMLAIAITVGIIDQITKIIVLARLEPGVAYPIIGDWFRFFLIFNSGAAFSFGHGMTWIFTLIQLGYIIAIAFYAPRIRTLATAVSLALVAGGALGNLIDRLFRAPAFFVGHVVDFISVGSFAIFNVADSAITVGVALFVVSAFLDARRQGAAAGSEVAR